jgi:hypothetical protein
LLRLLRRWVVAEHADWLRASPPLEQMVVLEQGRHDDESLSGPARAYALLAQGELEEAVAAAAPQPELAARVTRFAGASEGASPKLVSAALSLDPAQGLDYRTLWPSLALAVREHSPAERLREQARAIAPDDAGPLLELLDRGVLTDPARGQEVISKLPIDQRQAALVMAAVLLDKAAPDAVTAPLNAMLFGPERPYFH